MQLIIIFLAAAFSPSVGVGIKRRIADAKAETIDDSCSLEGSCELRSARHDVPLEGKVHEDRGGIRQRIRRVSENEPPVSTGFTEALKRNWAKGTLSSPLLQDLSETASAQGASGVEHIMKIGAKGKHPQNYFRDLKVAFGWPSLAPSFSWFDIPGKNGIISQPFLLPHEFFAQYNLRNELWRTKVV